MELNTANQQFGNQTPSFDDFSREKSFTGNQSLENILINIPVKVSFTPNRKIIFIAVATITVAAIVSSVVAVTVLFLSSGVKGAGTKHQSDRYTSLSNLQTTYASDTTQSNTRITRGSTIAPIAEVWLEWGSWTVCAVTCGVGIQTRYRSCENTTLGSNCHGDYVQLQQCHGGYCPVYGKWTTWSSWNGCTASCDGGIQSRTRLCQKNKTSDLDCVGAQVQSQSCNSFICPDCSMICSDGSLSSDCTRCECSTTLTGRVLNKARSFVEGAVIRDSSRPYVILAETDSLGRFTLNSTCIGKELLVTSTDHQDNITVISNPDIEIIMENIVLPYFTMNPSSKDRLSSESVTFCCHADGKPEIKYYEWFKDGILLNSSQNSNGTHLHLTNLSFKDSGEYVCRANSNAGSRKSAVATLSVRDKSNDFCGDAYQQKWQRLPDDCVQSDGTTLYEVGTCAYKTCRSDNSSASSSCGEAEKNCCGVSDFVVVNVNCDSYNLSLLVVKGCKCQSCRSNSVRLEGVAKSLESDLPLKYGQIWLNGILVTRTGLNGQFSITVDTNIREATLTAKDDIFNQLLETTKSINILEDSSDTYYITIYMVRKHSYQVEISTYVENAIYCGQSPNDSASALASLVIPPDMFYYPNGTKYSGVVTASLTYFDPRNETALQNAPGRFEFVDEEGEVQLLETLGVFNLFVQDASGSPITVEGGVDVYLNNDLYSTDPSRAEGLKMWGLSPSSGRWETIMSNENLRQRQHPNSEIITNNAIRRRTRRQAGFWVGQVGFSYIYNIDRFRLSEICYFKVRIFKKSTFNRADEILHRYVKLEAPIFTLRAYVLYQTEYLNNPGSKCFKTRCGYDGYIEITQNYQSPSKEVALIPADPKSNHSLGIDFNSARQINYSVSKSGRALGATFLSSSDGPFFRDKTECENSGFHQNHFRFFEEYEDPDIYTFKKIFNPLTDINVGIDPSLLRQTIRKVWYPQFRNDKHTACAMKINLIYGGNEIYKIKVRVISFVGTNAHAKGDIYGIRESEVDKSGTVCLEYKCTSENLDINLETKETDITRVKIIPIVGKTISCSVNNDNLHHQTGHKVYENYVPLVSNNNNGLYYDFTDSGQLNKIGPGALKGCSDGIYSAVSFICL